MLYLPILVRHDLGLASPKKQDRVGQGIYLVMLAYLILGFSGFIDLLGLGLLPMGLTSADC